MPDSPTYAGGMFDLSPTIVKLVHLAERTDSIGEREAARMQLMKRGYFLDHVGILWDKNNVPSFAKDKDA